MRELINILTEAPLQNTNTQELNSFKSVIASKIKQLPPDDATAKALREIEDLLKHVHAGGKVGIINGELQRLNDPTVQAAQKMLARYILSMDMTPAEREHLFDLWRNDKLVNRKKLLTVGKKTLGDVITDYDKPYVRELVDDLMHIAELGQGKGEFGLSVLSKNINKPEGKGDLLIDGKKIEAKTTDGGAGRFTDQEVRPGEGFEAAARALNAFVKQHGVSIPGSGVSLTAAAQMGQQFDKKTQTQFFKLVENVIGILFNHTQPTAPIMQALKNGDAAGALQAYAQANFNYYMGMKDDEGVLYINLTKDPISIVFFRNAEELAKSSLRFHAGTVYISSIKDVRLPYPQMEIVDTTFGANARAAAEKAAQKAATQAAKAAPVAMPTRDTKYARAKLNADFRKFVLNIAAQNGIHNLTPQDAQDLVDHIFSMWQTGRKETEIKRELKARLDMAKAAQDAAQTRQPRSAVQPVRQRRV